MFFGYLQRPCLENSCLLDNGVPSMASLETERSLLKQNVKILLSIQVEGRKRMSCENASRADKSLNVVLPQLFFIFLL